MSIKKSLFGTLMLLLAAFFWGSTFVAQSSAAETISPFSYLFARSAIGALALLLVIFFRIVFQRRRTNGESIPQKALFTKKTLKGGVLCGIALTAASALQQYGIHLGAGAGEAGFLTAVYMFFVPLLLFLFYRKKPALNILLGAILTIVGLYFLCLKGQAGNLPGIGQLLVLGCALVYAVHMLIVDRFEDADGMALSAIQFATCALISLPISLIFEHPTAGTLMLAWFPILYAGIFSSAVAYTLQIYGQRKTHPALGAVVMSTESVIALLSQWACAAMGIFGTPFSLSFDQIFGSLLAFCGILCAQPIFQSFQKKSS